MRAAAAVRTALADHARLRDMGEAARAHAQQHLTPRAIADHVIGEVPTA